MATSPGQHIVDRRYAICGAFDLRELHRFHQSRRCQQEGRVRDAPCRGDDLTTTAHDGILSQLSIEDFELATADLLIAQGAFFGGPLEALNQTLLALLEEILVHLARQRVVDKHVRAIVLRAKGPDRACGEQIPIVAFREEVTDAAVVPIDLDFALLNVFAYAFLQRLRNHVKLVFLVRRFRKALQRACLHDGLTKLHDWIRNLDLKVTIQPPQIMQNAIQVDLTCATNNVLPAFLDFGLRKPIRLIDFSETINHLW
mmetsp:Transcript_47931/g.120835  ORF Transcript_47931/g.120835 Transcript_47931/m.120835 type:complete len:257 (+) Transcript_47931:622-1392(+)